ncbi:MAG: sugar phosphate isomerase/epimerase [Armatimonadetes bacterium]|nr:sugar phosphate isomerase/epimerase [Armatimonadota bacterium]
MSRMQIGCQTYTWQMSGEKYRGRVKHIASVVSRAGFGGLEPEIVMLGDFYPDAGRLAGALERSGLSLAAIAFVQDWQHSQETDEERQAAETAFRFLDRFPGCLLALGQMPGRDRSALRERQQNTLACLNAAGKRAADRGLACAYHPNSPAGSLFRTEEDYRVLLDGLDAVAVGFAPDAGHIARGGMDPVKIFGEYRPLIRHVHFKDMDSSGGWAEMGQGMIDFPAIVASLHETGYTGWIMVEDESPRAESDPDAVTLDNGRYVRERPLPILKR